MLIIEQVFDTGWCRVIFPATERCHSSFAADPATDMAFRTPGATYKWAKVKRKCSVVQHVAEEQGVLTRNLQARDFGSSREKCGCKHSFSFLAVLWLKVYRN